MKKIVFLLVFILGMSIFSGTDVSADSTVALDQNKINVQHTIPYPSGYNTTAAGASAYQRKGDHLDSPYFAHPDYFNMTGTDYRTIISNFMTYQQTTEYTCGPAAVLMVLWHYGVKDKTELQLAKDLKTNYDWNGNNTINPGQANDPNEFGTSAASIADYFTTLGWHVESSKTAGDASGYSFKSKVDFQKWIIDQINNKKPVLVGWSEWKGHWQVIIGYDTMGTTILGDDMLIMADPYDTADHWQDGYSVVPMERFYKMWYDADMPSRHQEWVLTYPK